MSSPSIIIIGGGPVGLFMASELALYGLRVTLYEKRTVPNNWSRGTGFSSRSLDIMASRGLVDRFLQNGRAIEIAHYAGLATPLSIRELDVTFPHMHLIPQPVTSSILASHATSLGVEILTGYNVTAMTSSPSQVSVSGIDINGTAFTNTAAYLIAADGTRSKLRSILDIPFLGSAAHTTFILGDVVLNPRPTQLYTFTVNPEFSGNLMSFDCGDGVHTRLIIVDPHYTSQRLVKPLTLEELQESVRRVGSQLVIEKAQYIGHFTDETRVAERWSDEHGRVFLAGDAAHSHTPFGAHGLNSGLQDASNLSWKLSAVIRGLARPSFLKTYTAERKPIMEEISRVTLASSTLTSVLGQGGIELRDAVAKLISEESVNRKMAIVASGYGFTYQNETEDFALRFRGEWQIIKGAEPVHRTRFGKVRDMENGEEIGVFELGKGGQWVEIWREGTEEGEIGDAAFEGWTKRGVLVGVEDLEIMKGRKAILIRPDGVLGYELLI
ncbi:hypothetical protein B7494_g3419 [Chlorociboria aeruginascens]|nr:hypothetical protein B7494_g3419 [Chlorociboria aeruginascens]